MHIEAASQSGRDIVWKFAEMEQQRDRLVRFRDILIIDDSESDAVALKATLKVSLGRQIEVRIATSMRQAQELLHATAPDVAFLDDILPGQGDAFQNLELMRRWGYAGPVVVVSGRLTRLRAVELERNGAAGTMHKDDLASITVTGALLGIGSTDPTD